MGGCLMRKPPGGLVQRHTSQRGTRPLGGPRRSFGEGRASLGPPSRAWVLISSLYL
jgi:hypothetical protein